MRGISSKYYRSKKRLKIKRSKEKQEKAEDFLKTTVTCNLTRLLRIWREEVVARQHAYGATGDEYASQGSSGEAYSLLVSRRATSGRIIKRTTKRWLVTGHPQQSSHEDDARRRTIV